MQTVQTYRPYIGPKQLSEEAMAALYAKVPQKKEFLDQAFAEHKTICADYRMRQDEIYAGIERAKTRAKKGNDYQILGLANHTDTLTRKMVQAAYRKQAQKYHPDKGGNPKQFQKLNAAYQRVLSTIPKN